MRRFVHERMNEIMRKHGWIVTGVPGKILYTVGLMDRKGHPELAIHGMPPEESYGLLRCAAIRVIEEDYVFDVEKDHSNVAVGYPARVIEVHPSNFHDWFGQALDYDGDGLKVLQILWCDPKGRFPGDPEYDKRFDTQLRFDVRRPEYDEPSETMVM